MGGGDLNLKKSWHPSTLRNIERVWKAEQKHEVEKQKIEQLQKELAEERAREEIQAYAEEKGVVKKKDERLDWMYQGPSAMVNRDDYLMGRKIDKTLELLQQEESGKTSHNDDNLDIGSSMFSSQDLTGTATVDLANKIREDPLFSIMKKEKEQRKNLLTNPVKMKQIQQLLQASLTKKNKKHKKNKKRKQSESESSDDEEINTKKSKATQKSHKDHSSKGKTRDKHSKNSGDYEEENYSSKKFSDEKHKNSASDSKYLKSNFIYESTNHQSYKEFYSDRHRYNHRDNTRDSSEKHRREIHRSSHSDERNSNHDHHRNSKYRSRENNEGNKFSDYSRSNDRDNKSTSKKLSTAERERLLQEMQDNAKWRDEQRKRNTDRYREEEEREEKYQKVDTSDFLKPMLAKVAGKGSLENRVKQKIFSIQRSSADMNKHFAKR